MDSPRFCIKSNRSSRKALRPASSFSSYNCKKPKRNNNSVNTRFVSTARDLSHQDGDRPRKKRNDKLFSMTPKMGDETRLNKKKTPYRNETKRTNQHCHNLQHRWRWPLSFRVVGCHGDQWVVMTTGEMTRKKNNNQKKRTE